MRWEGREESTNIEDRRGMRMPGGRGAGFGCVGLLVVMVIAMLTGADPRQLLSLLGVVEQLTPQAQQQQVPQGAPPADDPQAKFVGVVLKDTENAWQQVFERSGKRYQNPTLVLFDGRVASACGMASAAVGPFYCPADGKVYLDMAFFRELSQRFGAPGDFAQAYVVAHEVGHHVQNLLGISDQVTALQERARSKEQANDLSVRLELQADCFAGVYGNFNQQYLDPGDIEEGLRAAAAIGDDMIQKQAQGYVAPESWTHGSSEMRVRWLKQGLQSGDPASCDTFKAPRL
jgi:predicted metalloprotease